MRRALVFAIAIVACTPLGTKQPPSDGKSDAEPLASGDGPGDIDGAIQESDDPPLDAATASDDDAPGSDAPPRAYARVGAGLVHTCYLNADGSISCWGSGTQLNPDAGEFAQAVPPEGQFIEISSGTFHSCALTFDHHAVCWGAGSAETPAYSQNVGQATPPPVTLKQVAAGAWHTCGISDDDEAICWGLNAFGEASPPAGKFAELAAGTYHTCGRHFDGSVECWGMGVPPATGDDLACNQTVAPAGPFIRLVAGAFHTCGLRPDHTAVCWGAGTLEHLPNEQCFDQVQHGQAVAPTTPFVDLTASEYQTCGLTNAGEVTCWGNIEPEAQSIQDCVSDVPTAETFQAIYSGHFHTCGVTTTNAILCWGCGQQAQPCDPLHQQYQCGQTHP